MSRDSKTEFILICDRCKKQKSFFSENHEDMEEMAKWQSLNTSPLFMFGKSFDLCPECFSEFKDTFLEWLPPAFRQAFDKE